MDLFDYMAGDKIERQAPLAERMKPEDLEAFVGQEKIIGEGNLLSRLITTDRLSSIILFGPPGSGKTSLARIVANKTSSAFVTINAVTSGVKEIRDTIQLAKENQKMYGRKTILFIDEIHRFNKGQQDALLPFVEDGTVVLIGATTENPYFEVNSALISRSSVFRLDKLRSEDIVKIINKALEDVKNGLGIYDINISEDTKHYIADMASGDARRALNVLELAVLSNEDLLGEIFVTPEVIEECLQMKYLNYDKNGDNHYDIASAFIKSMRGSDPDAALYYLGKMIYGGENPRFIARRIVICASEDVGNADPMALVVANNAAQAVEFIGMPEGRIILAQAATYVASAPKSNAAYMGINEVLDDIANRDTGGIPYYLKDGTSLKLERNYSGLNNSKKYLYPHDYEGNYIEQTYLPEEISGKRYYRPTKNGYEENISRYLERTKFKNIL